MEENTIRLVQGSENAGFVEIYLFGSWGRMCGYSWDMLDAVFVCHELGYVTAVTAEQMYRRDHYRIWPYTYACNGDESTLKQCSKSIYPGYPLLYIMVWIIQWTLSNLSITYLCLQM